ncbi:hypothetical protein P3L10_003514 [Capsicum annuum]
MISNVLYTESPVDFTSTNVSPVLTDPSPLNKYRLGSVLVYFLIHNLDLHSPVVCYRFLERSHQSLMMFNPMAGSRQCGLLHLLGRRS